MAALAARPAMRRRTPSGWQSTSWRDYGDIVRRAAAGLLALGVGPGDRVALVSANRPEWLFGDLAILTMGGVSVPVYPTSIAAQLQHIVAHSEAACVLVEDEAQAHKLASVRAQCPSVRHVIVLDDSVELPWSALLQKGDELLARDPEALARARRSVTPAGLATIVYTSGTTGPPKGAMLSHKNISSEVEQIASAVKLAPHEETLSFLPLSHVAERLQGEMVAIRLGFVVNFAQRLDTVKEDLAAVRPTILTCVPRLWEKIYEAIQAQLLGMPRRRQVIFAWAIAVGRARFRAQVDERPLSFWVRLEAAVADFLVGRKVRRKLGLDRAKYLISGAAPLAVGLAEFFGALGLPILEAYGQTECSGVSHATVPWIAIKPGYVGQALPGLEVRLAEDGEILIRGDSVFSGYYKDPVATEAALAGGWLHTGDVGELDARGYLKITDRKKDIIITAGGKNIAPQNLENRLKTHAGISQVVVLGDRRKYLVALVTIDREAMGQRLGRPVTAPSRDPDVLLHVQRAIDAVNLELSSYERLKRFAVLDEDFSIESGELTPTLKVRRRIVEERHRAVLAALYESDAVA